jgi:hypothetical protein
MNVCSVLASPPGELESNVFIIEGPKYLAAAMCAAPVTYNWRSDVGGRHCQEEWLLPYMAITILNARSEPGLSRSLNRYKKPLIGFSSLSKAGF